MTWDRALLTAAVTVGLWLLTRWFELIAAWYRKREEQKNLIRALYAEIDFNTRDLEFFLEVSADIDVIRRHMDENPDSLPHITDAHHTIIYTTNTNRLHHLSNSLTARIVLFYGLLDKIKAQIDGVNLPSFSKISVEGKVITITRIQSNVGECRDAGLQIIGEFEETYPRLKLARHARRLVETKQE
ncbi:hypothetical protein R5H30_02335 [Sulfitobacter sp. D35]|uniref:hypothetical protein n=1 Tax=Sulfitobacter sp. D35 TaxID=3083252 RepID=UPI00296F0E80|nr:hypothetical protein [Sulfitobacter sp. D35]MDW4496804.1 hypothetical protein [Sulfitobacter sp. D35]